ncbi:Uu.00g127310.m01.CDS01 [Anthostomella pinea]|uniref:Uu.00g127310.m01.CDS01 n=1 Tax=Anthostomella pinea TaxID=933095 RepID=A0AAI8VI56_9PEZI|nr:Uu.00g127310.m01.CDS01 [Anthostomella pinea]
MISTKPLADGSIDGRQAVAEASSSRVVPKPVPGSQAQDPRKYQLEQITKRFRAKQSTLQDGTKNLAFQLKPSDPDFPFELDYLDCELQVPASYPEKPAALRVKNGDIPRGFALNIERGWERLVREKQGTTLLALTNALDKNLEVFLSEQKAETVTLLSFRDTRHLSSLGTALSGTPPSTVQSPQTEASKPAPNPRRPYVPEESFTNEQIAAAKARRAQEIRQLEARMGRMSLFQKSADGIVYNVPLEPKRRSDLPELRSVHSVQLIIPLLYPLQSLRVLLNDVDSEDAEALEELFTTKASQQSQMTLMSHLNYLSLNMHTLAKQAKTSRQEQVVSTKPTGDTTTDAPAEKPVPASEDGRSHIHFIPRPPEWGYGHESAEESEGSESDSYDSDDESDDGGVPVGQIKVSGAAQQVEHGTAISFPSVELHSIELLQVSILNISAKCERCKTINDITGLKPELEKASSCKKCATAFTAKFRQEMVHQGSVRGGFIDVSGCTVADMLPSTFVPTCAKCSTPSDGLVSVRGEVVTNVCRECHGRFTFKIPEVRFMAITHGAAPPPTTGPRRRQEKLGLYAGEPLPGRGACPHYRKSYRWFRFSCCSKVHPCDKCHDDAEDHPQEWANRMICGWCSREQNYAVEACGFCGRSVIGKKGKGFWEGGKGTRDKSRMSRKDKRKFRRVGGGAARKKD